MDTKKLERILILILALLNLFLLLAVFSGNLAERRSRLETEEALRDILGESGISLGGGVDLSLSGPPRRTVVRSQEKELAFAQALLGASRGEDTGGGIWFYRSEKGQMVLRGTGEMDVLFEGDAVSGRNRVRAVREYFTRAGLEVRETAAAPAEGEESFPLCCCYLGYPVYNAALTFDFAGDNLKMASGTAVFCGDAVSESGEGVMDAVTVLVRFAALARSEGILCSRIDALTPGYSMMVTLSGECVLTPVWHIVADTAEIYLNAVTGLQEDLPAALGGAA